MSVFVDISEEKNTVDIKRTNISFYFHVFLFVTFATHLKGGGFRPEIFENRFSR